MSERYAGIFYQPAIVTGMPTTLAKIDRQIEGYPATITKRDIGNVWRLPWTIRCEEQIGRELLSLGIAECLEAW